MKAVRSMLGMMLSDKEVKEMEYLVKRELEALLIDLSDERLDGVIKNVMSEKYSILFHLYKRVAPPQDHVRYALSSFRTQTNKKS